MKNDWRYIVRFPFEGWKFLFNFGVAFWIFTFIKELAKDSGYIFGGLSSTLTLFFITWVVGLPYTLARAKNEISTITTTPETLKKAEPAPLKKVTIINLVLVSFFIMMIVYMHIGAQYDKYVYNQKVEDTCTLSISYNSSIYSIESDNDLFFNAPRFKTHSEAMTYCKLIIKQSDENEKGL